ncbi:hypothetical protein ACEPAH_3352 [Sanghuangporus vaninii]
MPHNRLPLTSRPLDLIYFLFFLIHIPVTLLLDIQALYPHQYVPEQLRSLINWYLQWSADPVMAGVFGLNGPPALWVWFKSFLILEAIFQLPVFLVCIQALWKDSRTSYPLLLIYSASSATTTIACIATVLRTPISSTPVPATLLTPFSDLPKSALGTTGLTITPEQRTAVLSGYIPFLLVQVLMCVDIAVRVAGLVAAGLRAQARKTLKFE